MNGNTIRLVLVAFAAILALIGGVLSGMSVAGWAIFVILAVFLAIMFFIDHTGGMA